MSARYKILPKREFENSFSKKQLLSLEVGPVRLNYSISISTDTLKALCPKLLFVEFSRQAAKHVQNPTLSSLEVFSLRHSVTTTLLHVSQLGNAGRPSASVTPN